MINDKKTMIWAVLAIVITAAVLITVYSVANIGQKQTISTEGYYELNAEPDTAIVAIGFEHIADTATEAENFNARTIADIKNALIAKGLTEDNFKTIDYFVGPNQVWDPNTYETKTEGYVARQTLEIKVDQVTGIGQYITAAVSVGATNVNSVRFELSTDRQNELKTEATTKATQEARAKADGMAAGLGTTVKRVVSISDQSTNYQPYYRYMDTVAVAGVSAEKIDTQISPGEITVSASVQAVFEIK